MSVMSVALLVLGLMINMKRRQLRSLQRSSYDGDTVSSIGWGNSLRYGYDDTAYNGRHIGSGAHSGIVLESVQFE
jgi:hypothetical protein